MNMASDKCKEPPLTMMISWGYGIGNPYLDHAQESVFLTQHGEADGRLFERVLQAAAESCVSTQRPRRELPHSASPMRGTGYLAHHRLSRLSAVALADKAPPLLCAILAKLPPMSSSL